MAEHTAAKREDVVLLGGPTDDGAGVHVLRARRDETGERVETGELRAVKEGRPLAGEVVTLAPRDGNPRVCDVTHVYGGGTSAGEAAGSSAAPARSSSAPAAAHKGPARVANDAYRDGWDGVFARRTRREEPS